MKIVCPKCLAAYRVDLPDSDGAGTEVQCGQCLHIFLFTEDPEEPDFLETQTSHSSKTRESDSPDQPLQSEQTPSSQEKQRDPSKEWKPKPTPDDPESMEIVVEDEIPEDSLEKEALDDIWNQAVQEGAHSKTKVKETPPDASAEESVAEATDEDPSEVTPSEKKSLPLPTLDERQREIDQIIKDHRASLEQFEDSETPLSQKKEEKTQEDIDLEEQVTINEEDAIPSWEDAFAHQAEVEAGWNKAQEQDRIQEERQLAEALGEKAESTQKEAGTQEDKQSLADKIFAEAKARQEKIQEEIDLNEEVVINEEDDMPSWEEAFAHQAKVEEGWKKAKEQDRIQEEQQLAEALGDKYVPPEPAISETPVAAENPQTLVDDIFAQMRGQAQSTDQPPAQETSASFTADIGDSSETTSDSTLSDSFDEPSKLEDSSEAPPPTSRNTETDRVDMDMKQLVEEAFKEESEQSQEISAEEEIEPAIPVEAVQEPELTLEIDDAQETLVDEQTADVSQYEEDIGQTIDYYASYLDAPGSTEEKEQEEKDSIPELNLETADEEPGDKVAQEEIQDEEYDPVRTDALADPSEIEDTEEISGEVESTLESVELSTESQETADLSEEFLEIETEPAMELETELNTETQETMALSEDEQTAPVNQLEEDSIEDDAGYLAESETSEEEAPEEMDSIPELTLESADQEPEQDFEEEETFAQEEVPTEEYEPVWTDAFTDPSEIEDTEEKPEEVESIPESVESSTEIEVTEPVTVESEVEVSVESQETTDLPEESLEIEPEPAMETVAPQETSIDEESEELWEDLLTEHKEEGRLPDEEISIDSDEEEEPFGGSDFWDQVLEKNSQEPQTAETVEEQPVASASVTQDTTEREAMTDEELWQQAFPGEKELAPADQLAGEEENLQTEVEPLVVGASLNEESDDSQIFDEAAYEDFDDDEFEFQRKKRKLGPFNIPHGRRGDMVIGGVMVVFLLLAGSIYFTLQTFAPGELTDIQTAETEIPEGLSPREVPLDELAGDLTSPKPPTPEKTPAIETPGDKGEAILSDPEKILKEAPDEKGILKDLAESQILKDTGKSQTAKIDQSSLQTLTAHSVTMNTIMPVAYNPTDIRVLSFSLEMQLSNAQSANLMRESQPVYEEIINRTVEDFLRRKFYNDILYVKEKLQKRLQTAMNKSLKTGRVRKAKFVDFAIQ